MDPDHRTGQGRPLASDRPEGDGPARTGLPVVLVVMGVSGVGKSTVASALAARLGWAFVEGDDLHPERNRARMAAGHPLRDEERLPWLHRVAAWIGEREGAGQPGVITCSALRRHYRDLLREGHPTVRFVHLVAPPEVIGTRANARTGHFMPPTLLGSQLAALDPLQPDEPGMEIDASGEPAEVTARIVARLRGP